MKNFFIETIKNKSIIIAAITILVAVCALLVTSLFPHIVAFNSKEVAVQKIMKTCGGKGDPSRCYEREVPKLLDNYSVAETFDVIRTIRKKDPKYQFCHVLAHLIGEKRVSEDPSQWIEVLSENPTDSLCSNGYLHGVIGGKFRADVLEESEIEKLIPDFSRACEARGTWQPTEFQRAVCYHGMGHLYVFITDANLPLALSVCEKTAPEVMRRVCIEGVFMQIQQAIEPDDFQLIARMPIKLTKSNIREFCATFKNDQHEGACLRESWPLFNKELKDGTGVERFCSGQPNNAEENKCYNTVAAIIGRTSLNTPEKLITACNNFPSSQQLLCFSTGAQATLEENSTEGEKALLVCQKAPQNIITPCLNTLAQRSGFILGRDTPALQNFCKILPQEQGLLCSK